MKNWALLFLFFACFGLNATQAKISRININCSIAESFYNLKSNEDSVFSKSDSVPPAPYKIINPYRNVDFSNFGKYKTNLHSHTTLSDGSDTPKEQIAKHLSLNYDILALTDHDGNRNAPTYPWSRYILESPIAFQGEFCELYQISGKKILSVMGSELGQTGFLEDHHRTAVMCSIWDKPNEYKEWGLNKDFRTRFEYADKKIMEKGGVWFFAHPSLHYNFYSYDWYLDFIKESKSFAGLEIFTYYKYNAIELWDFLLKNLMPLQNITGHASTDDHGTQWGPDNRIGVCYDILLMKDLSPQSFKNALINGESYFIYDQKGNDPNRNSDSAIPVINNIRVDEMQGTITIEASNYSEIRWIYNGKTVGSGSTFSLGVLNFNYIRAEIIGLDGCAVYTQAFGLVNSYQQQTTENTLNIHPNPVKYGFQINGFEEGLFQLFDTNGRLILEREIVEMEYIPIDFLINGIYIIRIRNNHGTHVKKIIKM
jgi:hypothetical protein